MYFCRPVKHGRTGYFSYRLLSPSGLRGYTVSFHVLVNFNGLPRPAIKGSVGQARETWLTSAARYTRTTLH
jgi:hypothetical protein